MKKVIFMEHKLHTPEGVRDIYHLECKRKLKIQEELHHTLHSYGYQDIQTPTFEYFDVFRKEIGTTPSNELYKFFDREGHTLVLRPDLTPSIARAAATLFEEEDFPVRLCYIGNTFTNHSSYLGRLKEITQLGAELIGIDSEEADAEMLAMVADGLKRIGLEEFQISIGHIDYIYSLMEASELSDDSKKEIYTLINNRNYFGVEEILIAEGVKEDVIQSFRILPELVGGAEIFDKALTAAPSQTAKDAIYRLMNIHKILIKYQMEDHITFDLSMCGTYGYYTGIIFRAYTYGTGDAVVRGGRYDKLMEKFGKDTPSIGFAILIDELLNALNRQKVTIETDHTRYLTFALTKGRLAKKTLEMLEKMGITCEEMKDKNSRKLIFVNEDLKLKFFLAKGPDVPTYVEYGAADIGVVGKDTIVEEGRKVHEVLDLNFGKCKMCVCGYEEAKELLKHRELIRVATKYPNIAKDYFFNKRHQTVEIIKMNGSIELAPIVGLSEVIVDIVETGSTLKENGLVVLEEVCPLSARMIVNPVSMRMQNDRIKELITNLRTIVQEENHEN